MNVVTRPATTFDETPFFVRAGAEDVLGVLTEPTGPPRDTAAIVLTGGAYVGATNRNRVSVRIARQLAEQGFHAVRMDYHGVGDSTGDFDLYPLHKPFVADVLPALSVLEQRGITRSIVIGTTCFGARTALHLAEHVRDLRGLALYACPLWDFPNSPCPDVVPLRRYARQLVGRTTSRQLRQEPNTRDEWVASVRWKARSAIDHARARLRPGAPRPVPDGMSPAFFEPLAALGRRGTPVLLGYGIPDEFWGAFQTASSAPRLRALLEAPESRIEARTAPVSIHALRRISAQDAIVEMTMDWLADLDAAGAV